LKGRWRKPTPFSFDKFPILLNRVVFTSLTETAFSFLSAFGPVILVLLAMGIVYGLVYFVCDWYMKRRG